MSEPVPRPNWRLPLAVHYSLRPDGTTLVVHIVDRAGGAIAQMSISDAPDTGARPPAPYRHAEAEALVLAANACFSPQSHARP